MAIKGDAGFTYTPPGGSLTTVELEIPLMRATPGESVVRFERWSLDRTARDVVTVETPVSDLWAVIRFHPDVTELLTMLRHGLQDVTLTYYPSLAVSGTSYPCKLVAVEGADGEALALTPDGDRYAFGEFECRVHLRRVDGGTFLGMF